MATMTPQPWEEQLDKLLTSPQASASIYLLCGDDKRLLIDFMTHFVLSGRENWRQEMTERLPDIKEHICRFNDGKQRCDCYVACLSEVKKILERRSQI